MTNEGSGDVANGTLREFTSGQKLFKRYTLIKILGRGGMGVVWLARDEELEREVARKFLPDTVIYDRSLRFLRRIGVSHGSVLAITEATLTETTKDPNAQTHLSLTIGVKPRPNTQNGHLVRLAVSFYDLTKDNKMLPTDARTDYDWLTPNRDWTDATPKFLLATYVRPETQKPSPDGRRYGGFIVRVYFHGQLQDARAFPPELLTLFPAADQISTPPPSP